MLRDECCDDVLSPASHDLTPPRRPTSNYALLDRSNVLAGDLCVGCIVWLPPKVALDSNINCARCPAQEEMEEGGYNHPVVVLKIGQKENSTKLGDLVCDVACVSISGVEKSPNG